MFLSCSLAVLAGVFHRLAGRLDQLRPDDHIGHMKRANVSQAKSRLSSYLNDVQRGETVLIFDRDRLVARLEPVAAADIPESERVKALIKAGAASAPRRQLDVGAFLARPRPQVPAGASAVNALIRDREGT